MQITNLTVRRLTPQELEMAKKTWASQEFVPTKDYWLATFDVNGQQHLAGLRKGRRHDVANNIEQIDVQLRIADSAFDADKFMPEAQAADIIRANAVLQPETPKPHRCAFLCGSTYGSLSTVKGTQLCSLYVVLKSAFQLLNLCQLAFCESRSLLLFGSSFLLNFQFQG